MMNVQFIIQTQTLVKVKGEAIESYAGTTGLQEAGSRHLTYVKEICMQVWTRVK